MSILFYEAAILLAAFLAHFIIWRIRLPKGNHSVVLLKIFFAIFIVFIFIFNRLREVFPAAYLPALNQLDYLQLFLLHCSLTLAYVVSYSAIEVDSPSLIMLLNIAAAAPDGLNKEKLLEMMPEELLVTPRIKDLADGKMIYLNKDKYELSRKGVFLVNIFVFFRKLLNAPKGG